MANSEEKMAQNLTEGTDGVLSVELPAPPSWKKLVNLIFTIQIHYFLSVSSSDVMLTYCRIAYKLQLSLIMPFNERFFCFG